MLVDNMITAQFMLFFFAYIFIGIFLIGIFNKELNKIKFWGLLGCIISLMLIIMICFFPFPIQQELLEEMKENNEGLGYNFVPFRSVLSIVKETVQYRSVGLLCYQVFGNIVLFMPFGLSLLYYLDGDKKFIKILALSFLISVLVEVEQGLLNSLIGINYRSVDIDDVILNTFGGTMGYVFGTNIIPVIKKLLKRVNKNS